LVAINVGVRVGVRVTFWVRVFPIRVVLVQVAVLVGVTRLVVNETGVSGVLVLLSAGIHIAVLSTVWLGIPSVVGRVLALLPGLSVAVEIIALNIAVNATSLRSTSPGSGFSSLIISSIIFRLMAGIGRSIASSK